jgi:curved DNA-binding protein CbpA
MILGVEQTATLRLISSSYRRLALTLHPDRNAKHDATEAFQRVCPLSRAKLVLSIITLYMLKLDIEAWTSLRDIEGRKQTQSLRSHLPLHNTKTALFSKHTNTASASHFGIPIRNTMRSGSNRRDTKVEARTKCAMANHEQQLWVGDLRPAKINSADRARNYKFGHYFCC